MKRHEIGMLLLVIAMGLMLLPSCKRMPTTPVRTNVEQAIAACEAQGSTLKSFKGGNNEYSQFDFECQQK